MHSNSKGLRQRKGASQGAVPEIPATNISPQSHPEEPPANATTLQDAGSRPLLATGLFWAPSFTVAMLALGFIRCVGAVVNIIDDCDETYNYWEPSHYLLYGRGMQTWEYSPEYAFRSYVYVGFHSAVGYVLRMFLLDNKVGIFFATRSVLGLVSAYCETCFYRAIVRRFGNLVGQITFMFLLTSAGMFQASTAYLPSTFTMYFAMLAFAACLHHQYFGAVACAVVAVTQGWPFAAVTFIPLAIFVFARAGFIKAMMYGLVSLIGSLGVSLVFDTVYYGRLVLPVLNIFLYNALGVGGDGTGANLYGEEPWQYYVINLFLNFNVMAICAAVSVLAVVCSRFLAAAEGRSHTKELIMLLSSMFLWYAAMTAQAHKEERFLYVIYPLVAFAAAYTLAEVAHAVYEVTWKGVSDRQAFFLSTTVLYSVVFVSVLLSASRVIAQVRNYYGPIRAHHRLFDSFGNPNGDVTLQSLFKSSDTLYHADEIGARVCIGEEWYRFPSHYFLPDTYSPSIQLAPPTTSPDSSTLEVRGETIGEAQNAWYLSPMQRPTFTRSVGGPVQLAFVKSSFGGLLPQHFLPLVNNGTHVVRPNFNDINKEVKDRYVDPLSCDFFVQVGAQGQKPSRPAGIESGSWKLILSEPILDKDHSDAIGRAFFLPFDASYRVAFKDYEIWQRVGE